MASAPSPCSLNVLAISSDPSLGASGRPCPGNALWRQQQYAKRINRLTVVVLAPGASGTSRTVVDDHLTIVRVSRRTKIQTLRAALKTAREVCQKSTIHCLATQDPFLTGWLGWRLKARTGLPLNLQIPADMLFNPNFFAEHPRNTLKAWLGRWLLSRADTIRVSTHAESQRLGEPGIEPDRTWVVPFLVDLERFLSFSSGGSCVALGRPLVGFVGRLVRQKDAPVFLEAAARVGRQLPGCQFALAGDGPERPALQRLVGRLGIAAQTHFLGDRPYDKMPALLSCCDAVVSSARYEGTCMAMVEAAAMGKPVVATRTAGALDAIIDQETGFLVEIGDANGLAEKICYLLTHPDVARRMGQAGRAHVMRTFDVRQIAERYVAMWQATAAVDGHGSW